MLAESISAQPIPLEVGPLSVTVPALTAAAWLAAISSGRASGVIPGLLPPEERAAVVRAMSVREVTVADVQTATRTAIAEATGRPWWEAVKLVGAADDGKGEVLGHLLLGGLDPARVTLGGWCAATYALCVRNLDKDARLKFDVDLAMIPAGVDLSEGESAAWDAIEW